MNIHDNLKEIISRISEISPDCKLIVVTKTHSKETIMEVYYAGQRLFGENKVQEMVEKQNQLPNDIEWHMIGHLQRNKVKFIVPFVSMIQSVDSERLLSEIDKQAKKIDRVIRCLLQVHIAEEESKFGFSEEELYNFFDSGKHAQYKNVLIQGLMGMATFTDKEQQIRREFQNLKRIFSDLKIRFDNQPSDNINIKELSMGMSGDYIIAIGEGSTMVRVGSAIFGERVYK